jgi:hypothetical protein
MAAIIILGGHRSGTSLTARLVHELGFPAAPSPKRLLGPHKSDNPDGYYEDVAFLRLHRRMLGEHRLELGGWTNPRRDDGEIARLRRRYLSLIRERQADSADWSLKDPRLCLVGAVLFDGLVELEIEFRVVTTCRPVREVVASLCRRGLAEAEALRVAEIYEAGRNAMVEIARRRGAACLEISLASERTRDAVEFQIRELQRFLGRGDSIPATSLTSLVRIDR